MLLASLAVGNVANDASEQPAPFQLHFADRQIHRECRAILAQPHDFTTDADDLLLAGGEIVAQIAVVLRVYGAGISMLTFLPVISAAV